MNHTLLPIADIKPNPNNPRVIRGEKFEKLVKSIQGFPEMLALRPIVVNKDMVVIGGNMRLKACKKAGLKEVPVLIASTLTPEQEQEFTIKDNSNLGDWDFDELANNWDAGLLTDWGLDVPSVGEDEPIDIQTTKEMLPTITITFQSFDDLPKAEAAIRELIERDFQDAYLETF